ELVVPLGVTRPEAFDCVVPAPLVEVVFVSSGVGDELAVASDAADALAALVGAAACDDVVKATAAACLVAVVAAVTCAMTFAVAPSIFTPGPPIAGSICCVLGDVVPPATTAAVAAMAAAAMASGLEAESPE